MPTIKKRPSIPDMPKNISEDMYQFLFALKINWELDNGIHKVGDKKPTVDELIAADITNADKIT